MYGSILRSLQVEHVENTCSAELVTRCSAELVFNGCLKLEHVYSTCSAELVYMFGRTSTYYMLGPNLWSSPINTPSCDSFVES